ncbi:MAG: c-type cytochrome [Thiogranum sp.]
MSHKNRTSKHSSISMLNVLVIVAAFFYSAANAVAAAAATAEEDGERLRAKVIENIRPVGQVNVGSVPADSGTAAAAPAPATADAAPAAAGGRSGEQVYSASCTMCHAAGVAGAPKLGDKAAWEPRAAKGIDGLLATAISGLNAMPPKGTCAACSDDELKGAIEYMLSKAGL